MKIRTHQSQSGFSLVELLLTMVLILCLAAASVFTFTALYRSANLDEGNDRFQSLIRFAQAEAATTGKKVRLQFVPPSAANGAVTGDEKCELRNVEVTWEADILNAPGVFQTYTNKSWGEDMVNDLVGVERVDSIQPSDDPDNSSSTKTLTASEPAVESESVIYPSVTFYPDGSCDSAQIVLASRNSEDERRVQVRLGGIFGSVSSRTVSVDKIQNAEESADVEAEYEALFESSQPVSSFSSDEPSSDK